MPYPFVLPTSSSFSFSSCFECDSHPSLPLNVSTYRGVAKDALKRHKKLKGAAQMGNLGTVKSALNDYIPYLLAVDAGLQDKPLPNGVIVRIRPKATPTIKWRPVLSGSILKHERSRIRINSLDQEIAFILSTLGFIYVQEARAALQPLYVTTKDFVGGEQRKMAISSAGDSLMTSASIFRYLANKLQYVSDQPPCAEIAQTTIRALGSLAHAEATLLCVIQGDPYASAVAQNRNEMDKEDNFKNPDIPSVRAMLYARLCLEAAQHATKAYSLARSSEGGTGKLDENLIKYIDNFRRTSRAKACRFLGIHADAGGNVADGIGWLHVAIQELGVKVDPPKSTREDNERSFLVPKDIKKTLFEQMEDRRVEKERSWGADAGKLDELRVVEMLDQMFSKINSSVSHLNVCYARTQADRISNSSTPSRYPLSTRYYPRCPPDASTNPCRSINRPASIAASLTPCALRRMPMMSLCRI